jgi:tetratricopeptide (TPR) repeat protein
MIVNVIIPFASDKYTQYQYRNAVEIGEEGDYTQAISILEKLEDYEDSEEKVEDFKIRLKYEEAIKLSENGDYENAIQLFNELNVYANSEELVLKQQYNIAQKI